MRRRWIYPSDGGEPFEVGADYVPAEREARYSNPLAGDRHYDGLTATDGTDISTRTKHREYMKRNNLTTADDYAQQWKKDRQQKLDVATTGGDHSARREAIINAVQRLSHRR